MTNKDFESVDPFFKNFDGTIRFDGKNGYYIEGKATIHEDNMVDITELPVGTWTKSYKEFLEK